MKSGWDLFNTLVAARDPFVPCGDQPEGSHFPIREHVSQVRPNDTVISDYYAPTKAANILTSVCGLRNKLIVGNGLKTQPSTWVGITHFTDDQLYVTEAATRCGVQATLVDLTPFTEFERELNDAGLPGLARTMRETRLVTFDNRYLDLELLQLDNFALFFLASILVHRKLTLENMQRALFCSRDAFLWHLLQQKVRDMLGGTYEVIYFYTSRLTRYNPSPTYLRYSASLISGATILIDVCGGGMSLDSLRNRLSIKPALFLLIGYTVLTRGWSPNNLGIPFALNWLGTDTIEHANLARHPMVSDMVMKSDGSFEPIYVNPKRVQWTSVPQILAMHAVFNTAISVMPNYQFVEDFKIDDVALLDSMKRCFERLEAGRKTLTDFTNGFFGEEEMNTRRILSTRGRR